MLEDWHERDETSFQSATSQGADHSLVKKGEPDRRGVVFDQITNHASITAISMMLPSRKTQTDLHPCFSISDDFVKCEGM